MAVSPQEVETSAMVVLGVRFSFCIAAGFAEGGESSGMEVSPQEVDASFMGVRSSSLIGACFPEGEDCTESTTMK